MEKNSTKPYTVKTKFVFEGEFYITAKSKAEARGFVENHCGLVIGGNIHTTLPDEIIDWNFDVHSKKIIR